MEGNIEGSRLDAKPDEGILREVRFDQVHRRAIGLRTAARASTPEMNDELSTGQGDGLGSFGVEPSESESNHTTRSESQLT